MSYRKLLGGSVAVAALFSASVAYAEITADDVWEMWRGQIESAGMDVAVGSEVRDGPLLAVSDIVLSIHADFLMISVDIPTMDFIEQDDGTVIVDMADRFSLSIVDEWDEGFVLGVAVPGQQSIASETETGIALETTTPEITVTVDEILFEDFEDDIEVFEFAFSMLDSFAISNIPNDPNGPIGANATVGSMDLLFHLVDEWTDVRADIGFTGVEFSFDGAGFGMIQDMVDPIEALMQGLAMNFRVAYESSSVDIDFDDIDESFRMSAQDRDGEFSFTFNAQEIAFGSASHDVTAMVESADMGIPGPLDFTLAESSVSFRMPLAAAPEPQDMNFVFRLVDMVLPEQIWQMLDPGANFERTPLTAIIDIAAGLRLLEDLYSEDATWMMMMGGPFTVIMPDTFTLQELLVRGAGVELRGDGGFTFDPDDLETFDGFPRPTGEIVVSVNGIMAVLQNMAAMGLLSQEDMMGVGLMLGLLAQQGEEPDQYITRLEIREDGQTYFNGQPIPLPMLMDMLGG